MMSSGTREVPLKIFKPKYNYFKESPTIWSFVSI